MTLPTHKIEISKRTSDYLSIYAVEMCAIMIAVQWIVENGNQDFIVCSDSVSALMSTEAGASKKTIRAYFMKFYVITQQQSDKGKMLHSCGFRHIQVFKETRKQTN